jgi:LmbE family N-acetylglucosaminyl deacetylase
MTQATGEWKAPQKILVILAHPDDPEFFCGATLAKWAAEGHRITYYLLTRGDKGTNDPAQDPEELARLREVEQKAAAAVLGVGEVHFLSFPDGFLGDQAEARKEVTRIIRNEKPDILLSSDPTNFFPNEASINHPDHRAAGRIVCEAYFPASGNPQFFPDQLAAGLAPHSVKEVWFSLTSQPNTILDVTEFWPIKMQALHQHRSQIGDPQKFDERMRTRRTPDSSDEAPRFEEKFRRIIYLR